MVTFIFILFIFKYFLKVCIDIATSSFGMTKIVTIGPSTAIINNSTVINSNLFYFIIRFIFRLTLKLLKVYLKQKMINGH